MVQLTVCTYSGLIFQTMDITKICTKFESNGKFLAYIEVCKFLNFTRGFTIQKFKII